MKTTVEITDPLLASARAEAQRRGTTLRGLIEEGLRRVLSSPESAPFRLRDGSVGGPGPAIWDDLDHDSRLDVMYGDRA